MALSACRTVSGLGSNTYLYLNKQIVYLYLKITKRCIFVFDLYLHIQSNIHKHYHLPTKGKALPDINWLRSLNRMFGQAALR